MAHALAPQADCKVDQSAVAELRKALRGALLRPSDTGYGEARSIWNGMITRQPALIARVSGTTDVITCVNFACENGLPLSIRGGGHNIAGAALCEGGLMIDMSLRRGVRVDAAHRMVRAEAGATWGDVDHETQPFGLVVPSGIISSTGVAGFTMGGGFGWTSRKFGYAADSLISVDIVTADGELRRASDRENADLFWALRGGGGNFGAVTSFEFRASQYGPRALCGLVVHPMAQARLVMDQYRQITATAPDELCCLLILRHAPSGTLLAEGSARQTNRRHRRLLGRRSRQRAGCCSHSQNVRQTARRHDNAEAVHRTSDHARCRPTVWPPLLLEIRLFRRTRRWSDRNND
jgi:FAD/FMN-containing dehydrogenase